MTYKNIITAILEIQGWLLSNLMSKNENVIEKEEQQTL